MTRAFVRQNACDKPLGIWVRNWTALPLMPIRIARTTNSAGQSVDKESTNAGARYFHFTRTGRYRAVFSETGSCSWSAYNERNNLAGAADGVARPESSMGVHMLSH